ncbi:hypothetical protein [Legionella sp.]|uniref:hypothetical protein n=1 Tax=Legionella sp. TaxID=459 RepID=UPI003C95ED3A
MGSYKLYSAKEISKLNSKTFNHWLNFLYKNPTKSEKSSYDDAQPSSSWLHECWCPVTQAHSRANFFDIRSKYENRILNVAKSKNKSEVIRLLSLGSGGLFQDLMIILKLYYNGYKNIKLDCIEIKGNQTQQSIFQAIIEQLNQNGAKITVRHFKNMEERGAQSSSCDAVYALDFDDIGDVLGKDFSSRQLPSRSKNIENDSICPLFLGAYAELQQSSSSLFLLTFGKNYIAHNGEIAELYCDEFDHQFEKRIETHAYHDYYYINANILSLLIHLPFLKAKKKPLLINEAILNSNTTLSLQKILTQHNIDYIIASESVIGKKLDEKCASVLIIDDSIHDSTIPEEQYIHPIFKHGHAQVSRVISRKVDVFFAFNTIKTEQLSQRINNLPIEKYLERTTIGIQNYLDWCSKNASGIRGLTRFSHWYHGDSGVRRARALQKTIESFSNVTSEEFDLVKSTIKEKLQDSSNTCHSLTRFICSALTEDMELETLPDSDYKTIRSRLA